MVTMFQFKNGTKLSDLAFVKENWANYIIGATVSIGLLSRVLVHFQVAKPEKTTKVSEKGNDTKHREPKCSILIPDFWKLGQEYLFFV